MSNLPNDMKKDLKDVEQLEYEAWIQAYEIQTLKEIDAELSECEHHCLHCDAVISKGEFCDGECQYWHDFLISS